MEISQDKVTNSVIFDLVLRSNLGVQKYKTTLYQNNHQNMLQHAYEEALDLSQYLKKEIMNLHTVHQLIEEFGHDDDLLGKMVKKFFSLPPHFS